MDLKPLTLQDFPLFRKFYEMSGYEGYNSNFVTMYMWNHEYNVHYYANEHFLVALCHYEHLIFWNMPLTTKAYFKDAVDFMQAYSQEHHLPFYMDGVLNEQCEWLESLYPNTFKMTLQKGEFDYIYDRRMLETLSGKKMQKRRNHYNTFIKLYGKQYHYRPVLSSDIPRITDLLNQWASAKEYDPNIVIEKTGIIALLENMANLPVKTGCIEINGKIEAFIIGSMLNQQTLQIHVEKANTAFRGLYVAILKCFLEKEFKEAEWVNREDDLNIPTMRQAKMNLHPVKLLEKSFVYPKHIVYRQASEEDFAQLISAWKSNFSEDSDDYVHDYFNTYYQPQNAWVCTIDGMIVSAVHLRPISIYNQGKVEKACYIEGVSTHFMFRQQGYAKTLLKKAMSQTACDYFFIQAYDWNIYHSFAFKDYTYKKKVTITEQFDVSETSLFSKLVPSHCLKLYQAFTAKKNGYPIRDEAYYEHLKKLVDLEEQHFLMSEKAYLIYEMINDRCVILEAIGSSENDIKALMNQLISQYGSFTALLETDSFMDLDGEPLLFLQSKAKQSNPPNGNIYFNEFI